jgi:hypothetical protein
MDPGQVVLTLASAVMFAEKHLETGAAAVCDKRKWKDGKHE